jgi:hypothetical protein
MRIKPIIKEPIAYMTNRNELNLEDKIDKSKFSKANNNELEVDEKALKALGVVRCETCENRKYQDDSDDNTVSFQTPQNLSPNEAFQKVMAHEMEHVRNETFDANNEDREVISQSVTINTGICPECGRTYVSGGTTRTVTSPKLKESTIEMIKGTKIDYSL